MAVQRLCSRHRTLSVGRCPQCVSDRNERRRVHVSARAKRFRAEILERDGFVCHWCSKPATTVDYVRAIIDGGAPFDESNAVSACQSCKLAKRRGDHEPRGTFRGRVGATVRPMRGMLLRMAISLLAIVVIWLLVLLELHDAISS